jgi:hypothetical protein
MCFSAPRGSRDVPPVGPNAQIHQHSRLERLTSTAIERHLTCHLLISHAKKRPTSLAC